MTKYTEADILEGTRRVTSNGMLAGKVMTADGPRFRFIAVADPAKKKAASRTRQGPKNRKLSARAAMRAFNTHYKKAKKRDGKPKYASERSRQAARTRDLCWDNQKSQSSNQELKLEKTI